MSFWGSSGDGGAAVSPAGPTPLELAKAEIRAQSDLFHRMTIACKNKCVTRYLENDLNVGEMSCVDRCSAKFLEASALVAESTTKNAEQAQRILASQQAILGAAK